MTVNFSYNKKQVIQGLRYHFLSRPEIRVLLILVNVFAILSAVLLYFKVIQPVSFLLFSLLWFFLMLIVWRLLPQSIYRRSHTFQDHFSIDFEDSEVTLRTEKGAKSWPWQSFTKFVESPNFFHLYFDTRSFFLIPTDSFADMDEKQAARQLIKSKIRV
jgi:YcxB-like protein